MIKNCWYVAAWPNEVSSKPLARTLLGEPVVLYRESDGTAVALADRCVHRSMPLSMGEVCDDRLVCPYHGLAYDRTGQCVHIPAQDRIPSGAVIRSYPVVEKDGAVWIWMGPPENVDPEQIVPYPYHNAGTGWAHALGYCRVECRHDLVSENLLDLTHIGWVHRKTIGGNAAINARAKVTTERREDHVLVRRYLLDSPPPPTYVRAVGFTGQIDRWMEIDFAPGVVRIYTGANDAGKGVDEANRRDTFGARIFNGITPETEHSTHYFWSAAHNFQIDQPEVTNAFHQEILATFLEDKIVMEAQYRRMQQFPDAKRIDLVSDAGGVQARRIMLARAGAEESAR
jgi:phenylpropionate dioxygenase-like ring-hydroxylating dioxygenase large terminal subunit